MLVDRIIRRSQRCGIDSQRDDICSRAHGPSERLIVAPRVDWERARGIPAVPVKHVWHQIMGC